MKFSPFGQLFYVVNYALLLLSNCLDRKVDMNWNFIYLGEAFFNQRSKLTFLHLVI